ncbi:UNVERIFIED_ORG: hypothetical protein GGI57_005118 [Rhizobium aethiopicum]
MLYFFDLDPVSDFRPAWPKIIRIWARLAELKLLSWNISWNSPEMIEAMAGPFHKPLLIWQKRAILPRFHLRIQRQGETG